MAAAGVVERRAEAGARKKGLTGAAEREYVGGVFERIHEAHTRATMPGKGAAHLRRSARQETRDRRDDAKPPKPPKAGEIHEIPTDQIHVGLNPREYFDKQQLEELANSIKENGLLQPITVRRHEGGYQIIAGERRFRAMQALGRDKVPVIVRDVDDAQAKHLAILENLNRADMKPTETGRAYRHLLDSGMTKEQIAKQFGKSATHVNEHLALVDSFEPHLQGLVDSGKLPVSLVKDLASLSPKGREEAAERILSKDMGVRSAKAMIRTIHARENQMSLFGNPNLGRNTKEAHEKYTEAIGRLTNILGGLDDKTIEEMTPALESPHREKERIDLMIKQLQRMRRTLELAGHARDTGAGM